MHSKKYVEKIFSNIPNSGLIGVEKKNLMLILCFVPIVKKAILRSCGAGIAAADVLMKKNERSFCAIRPPGHHAERNKAMGFLLSKQYGCYCKIFTKQISSK